MDSIPQENDIKLVKQGSGYIVKNPSPYFLSITQLKKGNTDVSNFEPIMVPPRGEAGLGKNTGDIGASPTLVYLNDFGGTIDLKFNCSTVECSVVPRK